MKNAKSIKTLSLYINGEAVDVPQNPTYEGDLIPFEKGMNIKIGETVSGKELTWIPFVDASDRKAWMCDRCLIKYISRYDCNNCIETTVVSPLPGYSCLLDFPTTDVDGDWFRIQDQTNILDLTKEYNWHFFKASSLAWRPVLRFTEISKTKRLSAERTEVIQNAKDYLDNLSDKLSMVMDKSLTQTDLAKELGMTPQELNTNISRNFIPHLRKKELFTEEQLLEILLEKEAPSHKMIRYMFGISEEDHPYLSIDPEGEARFLEKAKEVLDPQKYSILCYYYGFDEAQSSHTLEQIGKKMGLSPERVRQIRQVALRKLRYSGAWKYLFPRYQPLMEELKEIEELSRYNEGIENEYKEACQKHEELLIKKHFIKKMENEDASETEAVFSNIPLAELKGFPPVFCRTLSSIGVHTVGELNETETSELESLFRCNRLSMDIFKDICRQYELHPKGLFINPKAEAAVLNMKLEELGLSTRAYNALHRKEIDTLGELSEWSLRDLRNIRNLGAKCVEEVLSVLGDFGIQLKS